MTAKYCATGTGSRNEFPTKLYFKTPSNILSRVMLCDYRRGLNNCIF
jgi:hypothetical protein